MKARLHTPDWPVWVVWRYGVRCGGHSHFTYWEAIGAYSEREDAEKVAKPGDRVVQYDVTKWFKVKSSATVLEEMK